MDQVRNQLEMKFWFRARTNCNCLFAVFMSLHVQLKQKFHPKIIFLSILTIIGLNKNELKD